MSRKGGRGISKSTILVAILLNVDKLITMYFSYVVLCVENICVQLVLGVGRLVSKSFFLVETVYLLILAASVQYA